MFFVFRKKERFSLLFLIDLAHHHGNYVLLRDSALRINVPLSSLERIASSLVANKILEAKRGQKGGVKLLLKPEDLTLKKLMTHLSSSVDYEKEKAKGSNLGLSLFVKRIKSEWLDYLDKYTLADIVQMTSKEIATDFVI